jgi:hypothetical protein
MSDEGDEETRNHRKAVREYQKHCQGMVPWVCAEALLYLLDGPKIVERYCLWIFPSPNERYLISSSEDESVDEYYILVRLEGKDCLDKISLGVCKTGPDKTRCCPSFLTPGAPLDLDPTEGQVLRIISIERDGEQLHSPEDASPFLQNARHIREVIQKQAGKCYGLSPSGTVHHKFGVLRTEAYVHAKEMLKTDDCGAEEFEAALLALDDPASYPWKLANRVADLGLGARMQEAEKSLLPQGKLHIAEDIWLVDESLPLETSEFAAAAQWAVQKSIKGTGSIPHAKMWDSVVLPSHDGASSKFQLMRMA